MRPPTAPLSITLEQREVLERVVCSDAAGRDVRLARALLLAADGLANTRIAGQVGVSPATVKAWRERFGKEGLNALGGVRPGRGRKPQISPEKVADIVHATVHRRPPHGERWSCRTMAKASGVSPATVQRIWSAHGLRPTGTKPGPSIDERHDAGPGPKGSARAGQRAARIARAEIA